jgi:hypothetical protein
MASFSAWRLYFLRRLLWQRTASAHRWAAVLRQSHGSTALALGGVELGSGSHPGWSAGLGYPLLSSYQGWFYWAVVGGFGVAWVGPRSEVPLTRTGPHSRTYTMPIKHAVPPLTHAHSTCGVHTRRVHTASTCRACTQAAGASHASCRSGSIYAHPRATHTQRLYPKKR